jgi:2-methylcitrate dehydratase PrpD
MSLTRTLAEFSLGLDLTRVPDEVVHETRRIVLDCVGSAVAGLVTPAGQIAVELARDERGPLEATLIGASSASLLPVVFANTVLTNALDYEPVGPEGHVCAVAVPAALAVGEAVDATGAETLTAVLAGLEVGGRIGGATRRPGQAGPQQIPKVRGTAHAVFAATAAAGRLLGLDPDQMTNAFGIAAYGATLPTLRKAMSAAHAPMTKYDHLGAMARNGVEAALLARRGFTGDREVLEGDLGFWRFAGAVDCDWDFLSRDLGTFWTTPQTWYKRYPVILYTHPGIEAVRGIVAEHRLAPEQIEHVEVRTTRTNRVQAGKEIVDAMDAWTSYAYNVAAAIYDVRPRRAWQEPTTYRDGRLLGLMHKIDQRPLAADELRSSGNYWEGWCPASATLRADGQAYERSVDALPRLDDAEVRAKYAENVGGLVADPAALENACWAMEQLGSTRELAPLLGNGGQHAKR